MTKHPSGDLQSVESLHQARAALKGSPVDCILLCHRMADPLELYQELRSQFPHMPIALLLHGEPWAETQTLVRSGMDEVLHHQDFTEFQVRLWPQ